MPYRGQSATKTSLIELVARLVRDGAEYDARFDERMERIEENLEKSRKSQKVIDAWLNRQPPQPQL
jgi:hypothetical protein